MRHVMPCDPWGFFGDVPLDLPWLGLAHGMSWDPSPAPGLQGRAEAYVSVNSQKPSPREAFNACRGPFVSIRMGPVLDRSPPHSAVQP